MSTNASRPSMAGSGIRRIDLPVVTFAFTAGGRSTPAAALPVGASILRVGIPTFSAPMMITVWEASALTATYMPMRRSGQSTGAVQTLAPLGGSTSAGGFVMAPDMACARFIKFVSSKTQGLSGKTIEVSPYG